MRHLATQRTPHKYFGTQRHQSPLVIINTEHKFLFFPVENSPVESRISSLDAIKKLVEKLVFQDDKGKAHSKEVALSWMYFMDFLIKKHKTPVEEAVIKRETEAIGFTSEQARDIIRYYHEAGTVVHFGDLEENSKELNQILV